MKLGLQMYSLRHYIAEHGAENALSVVRDCGFDCIEPVCDEDVVSYETVGKWMRQRNLSSLSAHVAVNVLADKDALERMRDAFGFTTAVLPYLPPERFYDEAALKETLDTAAKNTQALQLRLAYHNHDFELRQPGALARLPIDYPAVKLQPDIFWLKAAGLDPLTFLRENADNVALVHLKEFASSAKEPNPVVGQGTTNAAAVLAFAQERGHDSIVLEYEQPCTDEVSYLRDSLRFMKEQLHG